MDNLKPEHRKKNMQNIKSKDTKIEKLVRSALHKKGFRFRKNVKNLIGKPDIVLPKYKVIIFIDSCFWHMCRYHFIMPKTRVSYWRPKLERNKSRAKEVNKKLRKDGWKVLRFWEHQINNIFEECINKIINEVKLNSPKK